MKKSAGILVYRIKNDSPEFLLVHPGGPFYSKKDLNSWTIPKGEIDENEDPFDAAIREFEEETGCKPKGNFVELSPIKQNGGKKVYAWAVNNDPDINNFRSNTFNMEWPPKSGKFKDFPEIDKAEWFNHEEACEKILKGQIPLINELVEKIKH